jgi:hypothetical protein
MYLRKPRYFTSTLCGGAIFTRASFESDHGSVWIRTDVLVHGAGPPINPVTVFPGVLVLTGGQVEATPGWVPEGDAVAHDRKRLTDGKGNSNRCCRKSGPNHPGKSSMREVSFNPKCSSRRGQCHVSQHESTQRADRFNRDRAMPARFYVAENPAVWNLAPARSQVFGAAWVLGRPARRPGLAEKAAHQFARSWA